MAVKQRTIKQEFSISGVGLHTGVSVDVIFKPADENAGIVFIRTDLPDKPVMKVSPENVFSDPQGSRCTSLGTKDVQVRTVEHLMSVLCGLNISNLIVEVNAEEIPGMCGSAKEILSAFKKAGVVEQDADQEFYEIKEPIGVQSKDASIYIVPSQDFKISYTLDYDHPYLRSQFFSINVTSESFENEIAPCRTFCVESEAAELKARGLGKGASYRNTLVVGKDGVLENEVLFKDEFARHKILDFIGDLYLFGMPIKGHVFAVRSGHKLNLELLKKIYRQKEKSKKKTVVPVFNEEGRREIDINGIMQILPHRYPFLLIDRVVEVEKGKKAIGLKNVTINENYFQGHFPTNPVMPGVLMVEAMAQTAGVMMLTDEDRHGRLAFFMAIDKVKFRKVVSPGDQLIIDVEVIKDRTRVAQVRGFVKVNGEVVAEADMMFSFAPSSFLNQ
ncbi:MAG: bifunctional UDP-3-O-[3-hydroxymyristoyl] N-acetylglucosamine deacetylase/3-hydroxyacyl-ACP dehydratase [Candidatus Omnitrophica bacterium]|nr:bifunctional UDP-3-O-[3-hydroxymyristoyl] N-acetylglucosamine deacetylase/3-hydroxyacyl-ACP dehydratase [Candidatus Omnitrophota bacterium]MBU4334380.1 bifunctional UDP-3-O-[3-hydroxymyristoyl] N-acetylglucosamine deacetylase/3-hydroxyacyl-ACP dehydratase [Candidatus Omnitrophota bacterium]